MFYDNIQFNLILSNLILMKPTHAPEAEMFVCLEFGCLGHYLNLVLF